MVLSTLPSTAVRVRLNCEINNTQVALLDFWHEMKHAKDMYEEKDSPEWGANFYAAKRALREFKPSIPIYLRVLMHLLGI